MKDSNNLMMFYLLSFIMMSLIISMNPTPPMMMVTLISYSLNISMNMSLWKNNYFMSYIAFMVVIGGVMVIFLYFTSILIDYKNTSHNLFHYLSFMILMSMSLYFLFNSFKNLPSSSMKYNEISIMNFNSFDFYQFNNMKKIYFSYKLYMLISIFYMILIMIISVKLCSICNQPLRLYN